MDPRAAIDDFEPPWSHFGEVLRSRPEQESTYLIEPDATAGPRRWSAREWVDTVHATAGWLQQRGLGPGRAVVTSLGNTAEALAVAFAAWTMGARCVPLKGNAGRSWPAGRW